MLMRYMKKDGYFNKTGPHTSAKTKNWLSENNIQFLQWPPSSADLSPIENVGQKLKNEVEKKTPKNVPELREKIQESQHILTSEMRSNLMNSVSVRLNEVISSKKTNWTLKLSICSPFIYLQKHTFIKFIRSVVQILYAFFLVSFFCGQLYQETSKNQTKCVKTQKLYMKIILKEIFR